MREGPSLPSFFRVLSFCELDSTNEEARRRASAGAAEGTLIWAMTQSGGRGRRGRYWISPPGNLYFSIILRPERPIGLAAQLGFAASLAVGEAAAPMLPPSARVSYKWPNDVLIDGRKTSGILLESQTAGEGRLDWLVVGIGVNIASYPELADYAATSLAAAGATVTIEAVLEAVAGRFLFWYERWRADGFAPLRAAWLSRAGGVGEQIRVRLHAEETIGLFAGLDEEGALLLEGAGGKVRRIGAGDVFPATG